MPIDALPSAPLPTDAPAVFDSKAYALLGALPTFVSQTNAAEANVDAKEANTVLKEASAVAASTAAVAAANYKGAWSALSGALNIPASVIHNNVVWMLVSNTANVASITPGVSAQWIKLTSAVTLLATITPTNGVTTVAQTGLAKSNMLRVFMSDVGFAASATSVRFAVSANNGSTYSTETSPEIAGNVTSANTRFDLMNAGEASTNKPWFSAASNGNLAQAVITSVTGVINAIRFTTQSGTTFNGTGTIYIFGVN